jgi:hypothetical protein
MTSVFDGEDWNAKDKKKCCLKQGSALINVT